MRGLLARLSSRWLSRRGFMMLYRGQQQATHLILSPLARRDPATAEALLGRLRGAGLSDNAIAGYAARWHDHPVPPIAAPPGLAGEPLGAIGVTTSRIVGIAAHFAAGGVVYVLRVPATLALRPLGWPCLEMEAEYVMLDTVAIEGTARTLSATSLPSLKVNERDQMVLGS